MKPEIDFRHVLGELAVNQNEPAEVIRELISNSYDAKASQIWYIPLPQYKGFIFCDNGTGLDTEEEVRGTTPYRAFFSIGRSTKLAGQAVGYKCQGSKLCFASSVVVIITRSESTPNGVWHYKKIDNPSTELTIDTDLTPEIISDPAKKITELFYDAHQNTVDAISKLDTDFFESTRTGTVIIVKSIAAPEFDKHFLLGTDAKNSYIYNYIRTATKHADTRRVSVSHGFPSMATANLNRIADATPAVEFHAWTGEDSITIPAGYWYLDIGDNSFIDPLKLDQLRSGRFYMRNAKTIEIGGRHYALILCVDGHRRALDGYKSLSRQGATNSGIRLADQRGVFISVQGVKTMDFTEVLDSSSINPRYHILSEAHAKNHYLLIIDGPFDLVTNRGSLTQDSLGRIQSEDFLRHISEFLAQSERAYPTFASLVQRLNSENTRKKIDVEQDALNNMKKSVYTRARFKLETIDSLKHHVFLEPMRGEEHWLAALYTLISHHVTDSTPYKELWLRPLTHAGRGIDSVAQPYMSSSLEPSKLVSIEYKYRLSNREHFNHPLTLTDYIVCWELDLRANADGKIEIFDEFNFIGCVQEDDVSEDSIYFTMPEFRSDKDLELIKKNTTVICLKNLLKASFNTEFIKPPPPRKK